MTKKIQKPKFLRCEKCYDKGYSTEFKGDEFCMADFIGDQTYRTRKSGIRIHFCGCGRGKDLQIFFNVKKEYKK